MRINKLKMAITKEEIIGTRILNEIQSSNIVKTEFDTETKLMIVEFKNDNTIQSKESTERSSFRLCESDKSEHYFTTWPLVISLKTFSDLCYSGVKLDIFELGAQILFRYLGSLLDSERDSHLCPFNSLLWDSLASNLESDSCHPEVDANTETLA
jgi:hypothetical protein